jgi:hypothetical protein
MTSFFKIENHPNLAQGNLAALLCGPFGGHQKGSNGSFNG